MVELAASGSSIEKESSRTRMKVVYVINSLGSGGAEFSLAESLPCLRAKGIQPVIICQHKKVPGFHDLVASADVDLRLLTARAFPKQVVELRGIIRSESADLVHTVLYPSDILGRLAASRTGIPVLTSIVNTTYSPIRLTDPDIRRVTLRGIQMVDGWTARNMTDHFHAITHSVKRAAIQDLRLPADRITVIERGRDGSRLGRRTPDRRRRVRQALGLASEDEVVITVGRQEFQKGQRYLIEAVGKLGSKRPRLKLLLVGRTGRATPEMRTACEQAHLQDRVLWLGHRSDVPDLLAAADLFAFPSVYEGLGGALIEAMALGLPVVASDIPSLSEVAEQGNGALLVPPGSAAELADGIGSMLDDPDRATRLGEAASAIFNGRFTLESSASRMSDLYDRLVESK